LNDIENVNLNYNIILVKAFSLIWYNIVHHIKENNGPRINLLRRI